MKQREIKTATEQPDNRKTYEIMAAGFPGLRRPLSRLAAAGVLAVVFGAARPVSALPDHLTVVTTNPHTNAQVTLELDRYNLRAPGWHVRIYDSPTTYTVLPAGQVPEPATYRGRTSDGGMVWAAVRPTNLTMYTRVNYGTRWAGSGNRDPYEGANRYAWTKDIQLTGHTVDTGYVYQQAANSLVPVPVEEQPPANWYNNLGATANFGGPPPYNNMVTMPASLVRLVCSANEMSLSGTYGGSVAMAIAAMESAVNESDVMAARDGGVAFRIEATGIQTYPAGDVDTSADWSDLSGQFDIMCWVGNWGVSGGSFIISYPANMGAGTWVHELGHSLGGPDFPHEHDYQGGLWNTCHVLNAPELAGIDLSGCIGGRSNSGYLKAGGWHYYRTPVPTRANPDFASTEAGTPVDIDVLLNDWCVNTTNRAELTIESVQNPSDHGGTVTDLGGGWLRYTPAPGFRGDDLFRYYVSDVSGHFKTLAGVRVLVADPANPLIGHYTFEETSGANAADSSGASGGNRMGRVVKGTFDTLHAAGLGSSNNYGAIRFPGAGGGPHLSFGVPVDSTGVPDPKAGYCYDAMDRSQSVSLWYKPDAPAAAGERSYLYLKSAAHYAETAGFIIGIDDGKFFARVRMFGPYGNPVEVKADVGPDVPGLWYHLVGQIDRENGQVHIFVNGQKFSTAAGVLPAGQFVVGPCMANLGAQNLWGYQGWRPAPAGSFDELRIYTKALSAAEVAALYDEPGMLLPGDPAPAHNATGIDLGPLLSWMPGRPRYQFDVYLGTDAAQVAAAGTGTAGIYQGRTSTAQYQVPVILDPTRTYFWRVDAVDGTTIGPGEVWQFTTGLPSPAKEILSFTWNGSTALIDQSVHTVALTVPFGTNVTALAPTITLSRFATVAPASGVSRNFSAPLQYTVTAQDGSTQTYTATVHQAAQPGMVMTLPPDLPSGAQFRLVFVTSAQRDAMAQDIGAYNTFVANVAAGAPALSTLGATWKCLGSAGNRSTGVYTNANQNTLTRASDPSVPIYRLDGLRVADGNTALWGGSLANPIAIDEHGDFLATKVWTGTRGTGTRAGDWFLGDTGGGWVYFGSSTGTGTGGGGSAWVDNLGDQKATQYSLYAISDVLTVPAAPEITSFTWNGYTGVIDQTARTVALTVPHGTNLAAINPACQLTPGATVSPPSGAAPNPSFASQNPIVYTVSAGALHTDYTVTVTMAPISTACELLALEWDGFTATILGTNVTLAVPFGTDLTTLAPVCTVSPQATISPASGTPRNFINPQSYTVTAQDGTTAKTYTVRVLVKPLVVPPDLNPGADYRLAFVTSTKRDAFAQDIGSYNTFVANVAAGVPALNALATTWTCLGSAGNRSTSVYTNANQNTLTRASDPSAPIYRLDGLRVADGNIALWGGSLANPIAIDEHGDFLATKVWTGTRGTGTRGGDWFLGDTGGGWVYFGSSTGTGTGGGGSAWVDNLGDQKATQYSLYAISGLLTVPDPPPNSYPNWAATHASGQDAAGDANHNGVPNGIEYFMGATAASPAAMPPLVNGAGLWIWTIPYDPTATASWKFQVSDDLRGWSGIPPGHAAVNVLTAPDRLRLTLPAGAGRKFCRLVVTPDP